MKKRQKQPSRLQKKFKEDEERETEEDALERMYGDGAPIEGQDYVQIAQMYDEAMNSFLVMANDIDLGACDEDDIEEQISNGTISLTPKQVEKMMEEAEFLMNELQEVEERMIRFHLGQ